MDDKRSDFVKEEIENLRERSGNIRSNSKAVAFVYELLRDYLPSGTVEKIVYNSTGPNTEEFIFTNGYLAKYAIDIVERLSQ
jgi:hypothetical protein